MSEDEKKSRAAVKAESHAEPAAQEPPPQKPPQEPPQDPPQDPMVSEQLTYLPDPQDPPQVKFGGHSFSANLPKTVELPKSMIERLRGNRFFKVGGFDPKADAVPAQAITVPKTPDEYKLHAVQWFKEVDSLRAFDERWADEETLRQDCEVGAEDLDYLGSLARPRRGELKKNSAPEAWAREGQEEDKNYREIE